MALAPNSGTLLPKRQISGSRPAGPPAMSASTRIAAPPLPPARIRMASVGAMKLPDSQAQPSLIAREQERIRAERRREIWAEHNARMDAIAARLKAPQLRIMRGARTTTLVLSGGRLREPLPH